MVSDKMLLDLVTQIKAAQHTAAAAYYAKQAEEHYATQPEVPSTQHPAIVWLKNQTPEGVERFKIEWREVPVDVKA